MGVIDPGNDAGAPLPAGPNQDLVMRQVTGELHEKEQEECVHGGWLREAVEMRSRFERHDGRPGEPVQGNWGLTRSRTSSGTSSAAGGRGSS